MAANLISEVLDHAPADLTPTEVLLLVIIAHEADPTSRLASPGGMAQLARRCHLTPAGVQHVLERLRDRKLADGSSMEVRVPVRHNRRGAPVYAERGRRTRYRLPRFPTEWAAPTRPEDSDRAGHTRPEDGDRAAHTRPESADWAAPTRPEDSDRAAHTRPEDGDRAAPARPVSMQQDLLLQQKALSKIRTATGATDAEAEAVLSLIKTEKQPVRIMGLLTAMERDGDLASWLDRVRRTARVVDASGWLSYLDSQPLCEHGTHGGHIPALADQGPGRPAGWVRCAHERRRLAAGG